jgi:hypothetical protein
MPSFGFSIELDQELARITSRPYAVDDAGNAIRPFLLAPDGTVTVLAQIKQYSIPAASLKAELITDEQSGEKSLNLYEKHELYDKLICVFTHGVYPSGVTNVIDSHEEPEDVYDYVNGHLLSILRGN